ncbi:MAG: hypothetical protein E7627_08930 [Ruminococcaceae bacterium]|nr:hypothetical protein [Oscillospiraceae bacterium]
MKLYAPKYYKEFICIADKCQHSCCIGWEIDIDPDTMEKYTDARCDYSDKIRESIDTADTPHFRLCANERCPHLDEQGLCRIIRKLGEEYLCDICREHPRFYNDTPRGKEVGLGMSCEEACRLILTSDDYCEITEIGEICGEECDSFDTLPLRDKVYSILSDGAVPYPERIKKIHEEFGISPSALTDEDWRYLLDNLEYLDESHRELFAGYSSDLSTPAEFELPLERALAYFIFRHCTEAEDALEFRDALGFCLLCERLIASVAKSGYEIFEVARTVSEEIEYSEDNTEAIKIEFRFIG